jgi:hypothetical protein
MYSVIALFLHIGCANQQSPSGGPDDKTGPSPIATSPAAESVSVKNDASIEITFSEWILPSSVKGVSIFPPVPLKTKVKGNRLLVRPLQRLNDSTTYHLVVTSGLKDLRNNPISRPLSIIFSTGPTLDNGIIDGCVSDPGRKELQPSVALFRTPRPKNDSGFCGSPDYLVQTDSNGVFSFEHIRTGRYHLLAYLDKNSDYHLQEGSEDAYLTVDSLVTVDSARGRIMLYPAVFDTSRQTIASVTALNNRTIIGNWKKPFDTLVNVQRPVFRLEPLDTASSRRMTTVYRQTPGSVRFILTPDSALDSVAYRLIYTLRSIFDTAAVTDTLRINGAAPIDTTPPSLLRALPDRQTPLRPTILLFWSEPVRLDDTLAMADTLGDTVLVTGDTVFSDTSRFVTPRSLVPGHRYRLVLLTNNGKDLRGNALKSKDSTDTAAILKFDVIHADSLAVSLSGGSLCLDSSEKRKWTFTWLSGPQPFTVKDKHNTFRFDSIPSGKGKLSTFIDINGNNLPDRGCLLPFVPPEPVILFPDTIEARARWDVEGVELTPCDPCERKRLDAAKVAAEKDSSGEKEK